MLSFWGFLILLFPFCFFLHFAYTIYIEYQHITNNQQDFKKTIMLTIGGCIAFIALSEALPLFFQ